MIRYEIYLLPELSKFGNDKKFAEEFLLTVKSEYFKRFQISSSIDELTKQFNNQGAINEYIGKLSVNKRKQLTELLSKEWRKNSVCDKFTKYSIWEEREIPVDCIYIEQAETDLGEMFDRNDYRLMNIVEDPELWKHQHYKDFSKEGIVEFPTCLAIQDDKGYKIFDGIHRAIQMTFSGQQCINLYYATKI